MEVVVFLVVQQAVLLNIQLRVLCLDDDRMDHL